MLEHAAQVNGGLDSLVNALHQLIKDRHSSIGRADMFNAPGIMLICEAIKIIRQKLIFEMGRPDLDPSFRLAFAVMAVFLGCVECGLLSCVLLGDFPLPVFVVYVLMLVGPFVFIAN